MRRAWLLFGIALLVPGCDARKLFGEGFTEPKSCEKTPDCTFQTGAGVRQQICETGSGLCRSCGMSTGAFDLTSGTKECRDGYSKALVCDKDTTTCRSCQQLNQECFKADPALPVCDTTNGVCKACASDVECQGEGFVACSSGRCRGCNTSAECTRPDKPVCNKADSSCRGCTSDVECNTQLCNTGQNPLFKDGVVGQCADKTLVAWVDSNPGCVTAGADGTDTKPYCTVDSAINLSTVKYIYLKASGTPYAISAPITRELYIFGKGTDANATTMKAFTISSSTGKLTLSNVTIKDSNKNLLTCTAGTVSIIKSIVDGGTRGIDTSASCAEITIQQTKITNATGAGLSIAGGTKYTIVNSLITKTALSTDDVAILLRTTGTGKFAFNTVRSNGSGTSNVGGIDCGTSSKQLVNSVFYPNPSSSGTQFTGNCTLAKVVVGGDLTSLQGAIKEVPKYLTGSDASLDPADTACIDKADPDPTVTTDFFGGVRPLGTAPDIGYHEAK